MTNTIKLLLASVLLLGSATTAHAEADPEPQTIEDPANPTIPTRAVVRHVPPQEARGDRELRLVAVIEDAWVAGQLVVRYRRLGERDYREAPFSRSSAGGYFALIPPQDIGRPGIEYYIVGDTNPDKPHFASPERPHVVRVETSRDQLWQEIERNRLHGRTYSFGARMEFHDFGATHGEDRYIRSEVDFKYRLVRRLYSIRIGYGLFEGVTPSDTGDMPTSLDRSAHYGFGGARIRLRDSIWLDGRAIIGFGEQGFAPGVGASLMIGDEWRTAVTLGGEYIEELSYKAFITLQWDTVPGVLMAATAATTDQPSSNIDAGSFVKFEVKKPFGGLHLAGHISFGARGNRPGGFGGGLSTEYRF